MVYVSLCSFHIDFSVLSQKHQEIGKKNTAFLKTGTQMYGVNKGLEQIGVRQRADWKVACVSITPFRCC